MGEKSASSFPKFSPSAPTISIDGRNFVDEHGRVIHLRGANVGSASKVPAQPHPKIHEHAQASYVNRPFPLEEAPSHWARLRSWGLTFLRINVTWDAVEHAGPGQYDQEYLTYLRNLLESLHGTGIVAYVAIHQDVWSRYSGGSGAPGWTLEAAGFDLSNDGANLEASGAAFLEGIRGHRLEGERGLWPTGYQKLAAASMNTLFWGGETFAPNLKVGPKGINIQTYLQDAFLGAWGAIIDAVGDLDTVMGFEIMNEPHSGYIGVSTIDNWNYNTDLHLGDFPSPLQSFSLGAGHPTSVSKYVRSFPYPTRVLERVVANKNGAKAWSLDGPTEGQCPWEREGVWSWSAEKGVPITLQDDYFTKDRSGKGIDFYRDFYFPYLKKWEAMVRQRQPQKARLVENIPNEFCPEWPTEARPKNFVYAPHWYDLNTMFTKKFGSMTVDVQSLSRGKNPLRAIYFGEKVNDNYALQIRNLCKEAYAKVGNVPIVFGECGIPMDMNYEEAFKTGDWKWHERMLDALFNALEASLVNFNLWSYNPENRDDLGDGWNCENFSWFSETNRQLHLAARSGAAKEEAGQDLDAGARLLDVIVRPYAVATAPSTHPTTGEVRGKVLSSSYDRSSGMFTHRWIETPLTLEDVNNPPLSRVTELYIPRRIYKQGQVKYNATKGARFRWDWEGERLFVWFVDDSDALFKGHTKAEEVHRRVDIWVREPVDERGWLAWVLLAVLAVVCGFFLASEIMRYKTGRPIIDLDM